MLKTAPAVFAVENNYQIMVSTTRPALFWVRVGDECYYDESNGILRSLSDLHRVEVPMSALDLHGGYTVCVRPLIERKPYFTETEEVEEFKFSFYPVSGDSVRAYHISDSHNQTEAPIKAAEAFGDFDFLILNGDVIDHSGDPSKFDNVYEIAAQLTGGEKPVVFSRGNHDMRGNYAERFADFTPCAGGKTYYTFRLGGIWGALVDCGEDKDDSHEAYGHTICCHAFRERQYAYFKKIVENKDKEYCADGIFSRIVISHVPFTYIQRHPFDIEQDIYRRWTEILKEEIHPDVIICGHMHLTEVWQKGSDRDSFGIQPCPVVIGGTPGEDYKDYFAGCGYTFTKDGITVTFTDSNGKTLGEEKI